MNYDIMTFEYHIVLELYKKYNKRIKDELIKVINLIVLMINTKNGQLDFKYICDLFFSDSTTEYGHIGKKVITTKAELDTLIHNSNIRELFTVINNFRKKIDCFMFELLLDYKKDPTLFMEKFSFLNEEHIQYIIELIENLFDVDILDFLLCFDKDFNEIECNERSNHYYRKNNDDKTSYPTDNYNNLCGLWLPFKYGNVNQLLIKEIKPNKLTDIVAKSMNKKDKDDNCSKDVLSRFPFIEPLSTNEQEFLTSHGLNETNFLFSYCNFSSNDLNFTTQLRKKYKKLSIAFTSGHTSIMILLCKYFKDINVGLIILGCMIWLVPYNHSITEIFLASKENKMFNDFSLKKTIHESLHDFLLLNQIPVLADEPKDISTDSNLLRTIGGAKKIKITRRYKRDNNKSRRLDRRAL